MLFSFKQKDTEENPVAKKPGALSKDISFGGISLTQKAIFAKHLSVMLDAGLTLLEALNIAGDSAVGKLKTRIASLEKNVAAGNTLSKGLESFPNDFPGFMVTSVRAGEASGTLGTNLKNVSLELEKERDLRQKVVGAAIYPTVIFIAALALGAMFSLFILPKLTPLFAGLDIELPFTTRVLIGFSNFVQDYGIIFFSGLFIFIMFALWFLRRQFMRPITHWLILHTPIAGRISKSANLTRFSRTMGLMIQSGLPITEALPIVERTVGNYRYQKAIADVERSVRTGAKLSESLERHEHLFPLLLTRMVAVGEQSGKFEETLFYLSEFYEDEVDGATKALATSLEPILLATIGLMVGFLALSIITPIYDITGNIRK